MLRGYDALLVANLQEEQPRIIFDAYSQGVPCVSSETEGTRDLVIPGQTGYLFGMGDTAGLADLLGRIAVDDLALADLRPRALAFAQKHTHAQMHQTRETFLRDTLSLSAGPA